MATIRVESETETERGWVYRITVDDADEPSGHVTLTLSWADYEFWSHGRVAPERVAQAVIESVLASGRAEPLPDRFDAATARRWVPDLNDLIHERL
ncbi:MAG: hypothetical protein KF745_06410 [Phycisphaeraceae bacterium]|nr:hypothetical protein [Phycisphaeraceae bacterium]